MNEFARFEMLLSQTMGLDARSVGATMIERAVRARCAARGTRDLDAYWRCINASPAELQELVELVIVPETWFFRDGEAFRALAKLALSRSLQSSRRLRLLSLPCSTGEEPYSMAMALLDAGLSPSMFHIDAVDICTRSIATAQRAAYGANSFRGKDLAFRERHFKLVEGRHALAETVRAQVRFHHGNLFDPALLADECDYDFIFCRNVLIYFGDAERARTIKVLGRLLDQTGVLFVGPSESGVLVRENMVPANMPLAFAFRKAAPPPAPQAYRAQPPMRSVGPRPDARATPVSAAKPKFAVAPRQGNKEPLPAAGAGNDPLAVAARLADRGRLQEAAEICKRQIEAHAPSAAAFYLLALISDAAGRHLEARDYYRKTLYLDPDHTEALAHLAALFEMQGDTAAAKRMSDRARRATIRHLD